MKNTFRNLLLELENIISQLNEENYSLPLLILSKSSIGKHVRHILDLFECLIDSAETGVLNYDERKRCPETEANKEFVLQKINRIREKINSIDPEKKLLLYQHLEEKQISCETTVQRELLYNIEHCVHHSAIIRIGIEQYFPDILIPENFGIAYSTLQNREAKT